MLVFMSLFCVAVTMQFVMHTFQEDHDPTIGKYYVVVSIVMHPIYYVLLIMQPELCCLCLVYGGSVMFW